MAGSIAKLKKYAKAIADAGTGYDQSQRWTFYPGGKIAKNKECDCSSFIGAAVQLAGYHIDLKGTFYTGNLSEKLVAAGFKAIAFKSLSQVLEGDILIKPGHHTELAYTAKLFLSAHIDEHGRASGGTAGDQTGGEVCFRNAYNYPGGWVWILRAPVETKPVAKPAPKPAAKYTLKRLLKSGITGADVKKLQSVLKIHVDGIFGPDTEEAVEKFQHAHHITADGVVGKDTAEHLGWNWGKPVAKPAPKPAAKYTLKRLLKSGITGADVKTLQSALKVTADGIFGAHTEAAVEKFQKSKHLTADGVVGPNTAKALGWSWQPVVPKPAGKKVKITGSSVIIRTAWGTNYHDTGKRVHRGDVVRIIAERHGKGASKWGQISHEHWISGDFYQNV